VIFKDAEVGSWKGGKGTSLHFAALLHKFLSDYAHLVFSPGYHFSPGK